MSVYLPRIADALLARKLAGKGAVLIEGPKWCGKTTTAEQAAGSILYMNAPADMEQNLALAALNPSRLLAGPVPRLIDEWQLAPKLWDAIRFEVDHRPAPGQFILTGSAVSSSTDEIHHSGTGRFAWLRMRPMSLYESRESNGQVSLRRLFDGDLDLEGSCSLSLEQIAFLTCRGGWPHAALLKGDVALDQALDYHDAIVCTDASRADGVDRAPERVRQLLRSYARLQGTQASHQTICVDIAAARSTSFSPDTAAAYIQALRKIFVVEDLAAWNPDLRSKAAVRTTPTRYFVDPSIATAALGLGPTDLLDDLHTFGLLFEALCVRDLRVFAEALDGHLYRYRDNTGLECDAVIHRRNGSYGLIEIKLGGERLIEEGVASLKALTDKIDPQRMKAPAFRMVLTAVGEYAYRRSDGVLVVPIGCLKD